MCYPTYPPPSLKLLHPDAETSFHTPRYSTNTTNEEWNVITPLLADRNRLGPPHKIELPDVWNAILYIGV